MRKRAGVIVTNSDEILLIERVKNGDHYWVIPGGGIEEGEEEKEAACRELQEELSIDVEREQLNPFCHITMNDKDEVYYQIEIERQEFEICGEEKERSNELNIYNPVWIKIEQALKIDLRPEEIKSEIRSAYRGKSIL